MTREELVKQIDHVNKIRGDTFRLFKCFKGLLPPTTTLLIVPHSVFFLFLKSQLLKDLIPTIPFLASSSDYIPGYSPRKHHHSLTDGDDNGHSH